MVNRPAVALGLALLAVLGYATLSHFLMLYAATQPWAVALLLAPMLLALGGFAWQRRHLAALIVVVLVTLAVVAVVATGGVDDVNKLYVLQHAGAHLALAFVFAVTPTKGSTPLITALAQRLHPLQSGQRAYTRHVTTLWAAYFVAMATASLVLYLSGSWAQWSFFANLLTPVFAAALFVLEYLVRYWLHPEFDRISLLDGLRAYRGRGATTPPASTLTAPDQTVG